MNRMNNPYYPPSFDCLLKATPLGTPHIRTTLGFSNLLSHRSLIDV